MKLDVIVPTYNGEPLLERYLPAVADEFGADAVTVVDDASTDNSADLVASRFPGVRLVRRSANGGFSAAANDGIRGSCKAELVLLLNNDVRITHGLAEPILPLFENPCVFAVSPRILLPSRDDLDEGCKTGFWRHGMFYTDQRQGVSRVTPSLYATGCAAVYRRSMLEALGGFDEAYSPFYWEDADLCYRAWKRGWRTLYQPLSTVYHEHSASISRISAVVTGRIKARNSLLFVWRNIEDPALLAWHRRWLPLVLLRRGLAGDRAFVAGWREAYGVRSEALAARAADARYRVMTDSEIMQQSAQPRGDCSPLSAPCSLRSQERGVER